MALALVFAGRSRWGGIAAGGGAAGGSDAQIGAGSVSGGTGAFATATEGLTARQHQLTTGIGNRLDLPPFLAGGVDEAAAPSW